MKVVHARPRHRLQAIVACVHKPLISDSASCSKGHVGIVVPKGHRFIERSRRLVGEYWASDDLGVIPPYVENGVCNFDLEKREAGAPSAPPAEVTPLSGGGGCRQACPQARRAGPPPMLLAEDRAPLKQPKRRKVSKSRRSLSGPRVLCGHLCQRSRRVALMKQLVMLSLALGARRVSRHRGLEPSIEAVRMVVGVTPPPRRSRCYYFMDDTDDSGGPEGMKALVLKDGRHGSYGVTAVLQEGAGR